MAGAAGPGVAEEFFDGCCPAGLHLKLDDGPLERYKGSMKKPACILVEVTFKPPNQGGRVVMPMGSGYAPYLRCTALDEDLAVRVNDVPDGARFGERITVSLELTYHPAVNYGALAPGVAFQLLEGPQVVAEGVCSSAILE